MKRMLLYAVGVSLLFGALTVEQAAAGQRTIKGRRAYYQSQTYPWHGAYYDPAWGMPVALVVPPKAESQTHWAWGVGSTRITPIQHQFRPGYPGTGTYHRGWFRPMPAWPTSTDQFGDYYIRGPW